MPRIKRKNINLHKYIYVFFNSNGKFERTIDKTLIDYRDDIYKISIKDSDIWEAFKIDQYRDKPKYEYYERGAFEDYQGYWVKVNNFVVDYVEGYEYTARRIKDD